MVPSSLTTLSTGVPSQPAFAARACSVALSRSPGKVRPPRPAKHSAPRRSTSPEYCSGPSRITRVQDSGSRPVADLHPVLRGWSAYFRSGDSGRKFNAADGCVHERLAIFASRKHRLRGRNWTTRFTYGWITRLGVYRLTGNVHRATAHASR
ncbi:group II intron maturase-specific domain-containing protein [Streptomyces sp. NPDC127051]|uniref:group II intron maturase-specific domain-containing protein n=1 Tax=Streptomyces sp. NPDC127051 TaxID=3347119 RepID=UPI003661583C